MASWTRPPLRLSLPTCPRGRRASPRVTHRASAPALWTNGAADTARSEEASRGTRGVGFLPGKLRHGGERSVRRLETPAHCKRPPGGHAGCPGAEAGPALPEVGGAGGTERSRLAGGGGGSRKTPRNRGAGARAEVPNTLRGSAARAGRARTGAGPRCGAVDLPRAPALRRRPRPPPRPRPVATSPAPAPCRPGTCRAGD